MLAAWGGGGGGGVEGVGALVKFLFFLQPLWRGAS